MMYYPLKRNCWKVFMREYSFKYCFFSDIDKVVKVETKVEYKKVT